MKSNNIYYILDTGQLDKITNITVLKILENIRIIQLW